MSAGRNPLRAPSELNQGRYQLVRQIGTGGMATVWHSLDCGLGIPCAIKLLNAPLARDPGLRARFLQEAQTMARLRHPNIVEVKNLGEEEGRPYIVMELVAGHSLSDHVLEHGPMPPQLAVDAMISVLDAIAFAHDQGVVHRDLKPANVLVSPGPVFKLTDFGIARPLSDRGSRLTQTNVAMGTWGFMAPEQSHNARDVDERADVYAAGATLFAMLSGTEPIDLFVAEHDPAQLEPIVPELRELIRSATCYHPEKRYQTAREMRDALAAVRDSLPADDDYPLPTATNAPEPVSSTNFPLSSGSPRPSGPIPTAVPSGDEFIPEGTTAPIPGQLGPNTEAELDALFPDKPPRRWPLVLAGLLLIGLPLGAYLSQQPDTSSPVTAHAPPTPAPDAAAGPTPAPEPEAAPEAAPEPETEPKTEPETEPETEPTAAEPAPAPEPEAAPAPAPPKPAPAPAPPKTTVRVTGEAASVRFVDASGTARSPGALPAGKYTIVADFGMGSAPAGELVLTGQGSVTVNCMSAFATCKAQ